MSISTFEIDSEEWLQVLASVSPPHGTSVSRLWAQQFDRLGELALKISGGHLALRFAVNRDQSKRWISLSVPVSQRGGLEAWLCAALKIGKAFPNSLDILELDHNEFIRVPGYLVQLPTQGYRVWDHPFVCDYNAFSMLEELAHDAAVCGWSFDYQVNFTERHLTTEESREMRKELVRLQSDVRVPLRHVKQQLRVATELDHRPWRFVELLGAESLVGFDFARSRINADFEASYGKEGFAPIDWPTATSELAVDLWASGVHPIAFGAVGRADAAGQAATKTSVMSVWNAQMADVGGCAAEATVDHAEEAVVFLSYSSMDRAVAFDICDKLEAAGVPCWIAPRNIPVGSEWAEAIIRGIHQSKVTVLLLSPDANLSKHVLREAERTVNRGNVLIPVRMADFAVSESLGYFLSTQQWFDLTSGSLDHRVEEFVEMLKRRFS